MLFDTATRIAREGRGSRMPLACAFENLEERRIARRPSQRWPAAVVTVATVAAAIAAPCSVVL